MLLIACANVASLLFGARGEPPERDRDSSRPWRQPRSLVRQLLVESVLLSIVGGLIGLLVAIWTMTAPVGLGAGNAGRNGSLAGRLLDFHSRVVGATGLLFGLVPALCPHGPIWVVLKDQSASVAAGRGQARFRRVLVVAQVALSLLLVAAGLFGWSVFNLMSEDPGFRVDSVMTFTVDPRPPRATRPRA